MEEEIQIQTVDEVKNIDYMKATNEIINDKTEKQINTMNDVSNALENVNNTLNFIVEAGVASPSVGDIIENITPTDTTLLESQLQDALSLINTQQEQISSMEETMNEINEKINQLLDNS